MKYIEKSQCCGCGACYAICPKKCIEMKLNNEGFLYPEIDLKKCVECGLCEKVCPVLNHSAKTENSNVYAAISKNKDVKQKSTSGGVFYHLASYVISKNGVVFGVRWADDWSVFHDYTNMLEELSLFMGSKYLQSHIGDTYKTAKKFLEEGRPVLFTGTPCQIAGLKHYLQKDYENLYAVNVIFHSCPSPLVWKIFITDFLNKHKIENAKYITMRYKKSINNKCSAANLAVFNNIPQIDESNGPVLQTPFYNTYF